MMPDALEEIEANLPSSIVQFNNRSKNILAGQIAGESLNTKKMKIETKVEKVPSLARLCRHIEAANNNPSQTIQFIKELEIDATKISKAIP